MNRLIIYKYNDKHFINKKYNYYISKKAHLVYIKHTKNYFTVNF
jgi:hypothetical protein